MKLLLDECVDQRLRAELYGHEVKTVADMGWSNVKDGQLLNAAQHEFDAFITVDRNLPYQQHLPKFNIAVIIVMPERTVWSISNHLFQPWSLLYRPLP